MDLPPPNPRMLVTNEDLVRDFRSYKECAAIVLVLAVTGILGGGVNPTCTMGLHHHHQTANNMFFEFFQLSKSRKIQG